MAAPTVTKETSPIFIKETGTNIDAGNWDIDLNMQQVNFEKGFAIQTGTLTAMDVVILESLDGATFVDNTEDYLGIGTTKLASNKLYKMDLKSVVKVVKIRAVRSNAVNAIDIMVLAPNR